LLGVFVFIVVVAVWLVSIGRRWSGFVRLTFW
jgi:hypothetical protein